MCFSIQLFLFLLFISSRCSRLLRCKFLADCLLLFVSYWKLQQIFRSDRHTLGPEIKQLNYIFSLFLYTLCFIPLNLRIFTFEIKQVTIHTSKINSMYTDFQRVHLCWLNWGIYYVFICLIVHLFMKLLCDLVVLCLSSAILFGLESINESDKGFIIELNKDDACLSFCIELWKNGYLSSHFVERVTKKSMNKVHTWDSMSKFEEIVFHMGVFEEKSI